jgi:hypothetical protein
MSTVPVPAAPARLSAGRYALYEDGRGGAVLSWRPDGAAADCHLPVPAPVWQLARRAAAGEKISPAAIVKVLTGRGG